jgi:pyruvate/2-oxoglutarate dehydrogenase complex dihydrolipoamide acyltransferase (E2) component
MTEEQVHALNVWHEAKKAAEAVKPTIEAERVARKAVADAFFPQPKEGINNAALENGWKLKFVYKIDRKVDEAAFPAVRQALMEHGVNADVLVRTQLLLSMEQYRELHEARPEAAKIFDTIVTAKPGSPTLELLPPKDKTK